MITGVFPSATSPMTFSTPSVGRGSFLLARGTRRLQTRSAMSSAMRSASSWSSLVRAITVNPASGTSA